MNSVIISFPRSGRTWLNVMIGLAICHHRGVSTDQCERERKKVVGATHDKTDKSLRVPYNKLGKVKIQYSGQKVLLLLREPKDTLVSAWLHAALNKKIYKNSLYDYIRDPRFGVMKIVTFYNIWFENNHIPAGFKSIWYEELCRTPFKALKSICKFFELPCTDTDIEFAVKTATLENLISLESSKRKNQDPESRYFRRGKIGGFVDYMSKEEIELCDKTIKTLMWPLYEF